LKKYFDISNLRYLSAHVDYAKTIAEAGEPPPIVVQICHAVFAAVYLVTHNDSLDRIIYKSIQLRTVECFQFKATSSSHHCGAK
jgi:hypothetical protein